MRAKETKDRGEKDRRTHCGCSPGDFQEMFQKMSKCCVGQGDFPDCKDVMENMMATCCGPKTESAKADSTES